MNIAKIVNEQREYFDSNITKSVEYRRDALVSLKKAIKSRETDILLALETDLGKHHFEGFMTEIAMIYQELDYAIKHLKSWTKVKGVKSPIFTFPAKSYIHPTPLGSVLIMSPWNYPLQLAIAPLIGAIAGGNVAIIKPSEFAPSTAKVISEIITATFPPGYVTTIVGDIAVATELLSYRWDKIFFTGSTKVGKIVMEQASRHLTPVTLELGGKSPTIVDETANIPLAAKRIIWGKLVNCGQTCVAPDYCLCHHSIKEELVLAMKKAITQMYGDDIKNNKDYPRIINQQHMKRIISLADDLLITYHMDSCYIEPYVADNIDYRHPLMEEELFAPILPVLPYDNLEQAIQYIKSQPTPLACYIFSNDEHNKSKILASLSFGGGTINDTIMHLSTDSLPFGGIGESGMGNYHGKASFDCFTHYRSIMSRGKLDISLRYPPFNNKIELLRKLFK